jgi:lysophospholipase L1-like esterase
VSDRFLAFLVAVLLASCAGSTAVEPSILRDVECVRDSEGLAPEVWESNITAYEASDAESPPDPGSILFVGSSSIVFWDTLSEDMAPMPVLNRGFGGSVMANVTHFADRIVLPYEPTAIVLYAGDNDIAFGSSADCAFVDFEVFVDRIREAAEDTPIYYISIKPSPARWEQWPEMQRANELIRAWTTTRSTVHFIDVSGAMLGEQGEPIEALYVEDGLHLSPAGYELWTSIVQPRLAADLGF